MAEELPQVRDDRSLRVLAMCTVVYETGTSALPVCAEGTPCCPVRVDPAMTLDEAIAAVEATFDSAQLRVDRRLAREDGGSYLLLVLDASGGGHEDDGPISNGPRLVDKETGRVLRLTVPAAVDRAKRMALVRQRPRQDHPRRT